MGMETEESIGDRHVCTAMSLGPLGFSVTGDEPDCKGPKPEELIWGYSAGRTL